jgi:hypothetical protein
METSKAAKQAKFKKLFYDENKAIMMIHVFENTTH